DYRAGATNVYWVSAQNQFFALVTMLETNQPADSIMVHRVNLPPPSAEEIAVSSRTVRDPFGLETVLAYPSRSLAPDQEFVQRFNIFAGPKEYRTLARLSDTLENHLDQVMGFGAFTGPISKGLLFAMNWMHRSLSLPYGLTIVFITIVIRLAFWPLTRAST